LDLLEHIKGLEEKLLQPTIRHSRFDLESLLADEFIEIASTGISFNKTEIINALLKESDVHFVLKNFKVTSLSTDVTLVNYLAIKNSHVFSLRSSIWKYRDDKWQLIFHQGTVCHSCN